jgi:hypothetical protein
MGVSHREADANIMNWEAIAAIAEVGGAIAVVATLVYLAFQIRQNTQATRISAFHQAQEQLWSVSAAVSTDPALAEIVARSMAGGTDKLEPADRVRLEFAFGAFYFGIESLLSLNEKGLIDEELWDNLVENNFRLLGSPLGREYLASRRGSISRRLEALINDRINRRKSAWKH